MRIHWIKELLYLVAVVGKGKDIAELSTLSFNRDDVADFEAHEIHDIAMGNPELFEYCQTEQVVNIKV